MHEIKTDKKEHILNVAEEVFSEFGYEGASTRYLAGQAGVNMAMLNYYFGSKDGLLKAVLERRLAGTRQLLVQVIEQPDTSSEVKLAQAIEIYQNKLTTDRRFHRLIHREISLSQRSELSDFLSENIVLNLNIFKTILEEGIRKGEFKPVDVEMTVASIFGIFYYIFNSRQVTSKMLNKDLQNPEVLENEIKPRIKKFLHDYLQAFLLRSNNEI